MGADENTGIGSWSADEFYHALHAGVGRTADRRTGRANRRGGADGGLRRLALAQSTDDVVVLTLAPVGGAWQVVGDTDDAGTSPGVAAV